VAERIEDTAQPPAVLIGHLPGRTSPGHHRLGEYRVRVIRHQQEAAGAPPIACGLNRGPPAPPEETRKDASPMESWATMSSPSPTWCCTAAPNAAQ